MGRPLTYLCAAARKQVRFALQPQHATDVAAPIALGRDQRQGEDLVANKWIPSDIPEEKKFILHELLQNVEGKESFLICYIKAALPS